jgi:hypothetical protein
MAAGLAAMAAILLLWRKQPVILVLGVVSVLGLGGDLWL